MTLRATLTNRITGNFKAALDVGEVDYPLDLNLMTQFLDGTGANQANQAFTDKRTIAASSTDSLDFAGGLTDAFGNTLTFTSVKALIIHPSAANTNNVEIEEPASNGVGLFDAAGDMISLKPNGKFVWIDPTAAGLPVTAGTGDLLDINNSAGGSTVEYTIIVIGTV